MIAGLIVCASCAEDSAHGLPAGVEVGLRAEGLLRADGPHAGHGPAAADLLVDPDPLARSHRRLRRAATERCAEAGSQGKQSAAATEEYTRSDSRDPSRAPAGLRWRSAGRCATGPCS